MTPDPYGTHWRRRIRPYILNRDGWTCWRCGINLRTLPPRQRTVDHINPLADGGDHHPANLKACCGSCNSTRSLEAQRRRTRTRRA